jgi:thiosulfate/3-mercaptopyruvate sulfurtransferase
LREERQLKNNWNKHFVSADELSTHLNDPQWVVVDCRFNLMHPGAGRQAYNSAHIPGAVYADLDRDLASPSADDGAGGRHPLPDPDKFALLLANWGVGAHSVVVAYDDAGGAFAARIWWLLRWLGHERVAVLDGGLDAWAATDGPLTSEHTKPIPAIFEPQPGSMPVIDAGGVETGLTDRDFLILDARDEKRFKGHSEPIDRIAGHIPGAFNTPFQDNLDADKSFRPLTEINAYYRARIGDRPMESVACMCGSGVTACHTLLALESIGMYGAALYVGSWSDWISSGQRPVAGE